MHTRPVLRTAQLRAYHNHLQSDHDYRIRVNVLDMDENPVGEVDLLDGQVNLSTKSDPDRTASVVLSDPENVVNYSMDFARDEHGVLWVDRLIEIIHEVDVPGVGEVETTVMIGVPTAVSRKGAELSLELADKSLLLDHGVRPRTFKKGLRVTTALRKIAKECGGEERLRIPRTKKRLSRAYTVGMGENQLTPWQAIKRIAGMEMGWRTYFSGDGFLVCEPTSTKPTKVKVHDVLSLPDASTSFTDFVNYVKVTSRRKLVNKSKKTDSKKKKQAKKNTSTVMRYQSIAVLPAKKDLSEWRLSRRIKQGGKIKTVPRTMPLVIGDNDLKTQKAVNQRARNELRRGSGLDSENSFEIIPMFHLDPFDYLQMPEGIGNLRFDECSIPLGTGGNLTIGKVKWVSKPVKVRRVRAKTTVIRKKKKGGKKDG